MKVIDTNKPVDAGAVFIIRKKNNYLCRQKYKVMETAGITIERTLRGKPLKLSAKLKEAMWQVDNGQWVSRSLDDVLK
ncbi:hypothetical protein FACS189434_11560 [Bacteroidia bacterium]|nr:hypothetical protein FACS189434_11560 [Bacteroidia bacterium]